LPSSTIWRISRPIRALRLRTRCSQPFGLAFASGICDTPARGCGRASVVVVRGLFFSDGFVWWWLFGGGWRRKSGTESGTESGGKRRRREIESERKADFGAPNRLKIRERKSGLPSPRQRPSCERSPHFTNLGRWPLARRRGAGVGAANVKRLKSGFSGLARPLATPAGLPSVGQPDAYGAGEFSP